MEIIKNDGRIEEFNMSKIRHSVLNASTEINQPLTDSDLKIIEKEVFSTLKVLNREKTSSYEIFAIVLKVLSKLGFKGVCKSYLRGTFDFLEK
jgi:Oxygen-sensitive ribonucleoside-triphosphate reductase